MWWNLQQGSSLILWTMVPRLTMVCFIPVASESGELLKFVCCLFIFLNQCLNVLGIILQYIHNLKHLTSISTWTSLQYQDMIQSKGKQQQQSLWQMWFKPWETRDSLKISPFVSWYKILVKSSHQLKIPILSLLYCYSL